MSTLSTLWNRLESALRFNGQSAHGETPLHRAGHPSDLTRSPLVGHDMPAADESRLWRLPWRGRERREAELRERYAHVMAMMETIRGHLQAQDAHSSAVSGAMQRVATTLEQIAVAQKQQQDSLAAISQRVESAGKHAVSVMATVMELPASLQAQAEAVRQVARRMESSQSADTHLINSLQQFAHAVDEMRSGATVQTQTLNDIAGASDRHHALFQSVLREQNRRLITICGVTSALTLTAMIAAVAIAMFAPR